MVDINAPVATAQAQRGQLQEIFQGQRAEEQGFLSDYAKTIQSQPKMSAISERISNELGLPTLRANAQSLQNTLFNLPDTYSKATTGRDVNANQLARMVGQQQAKLAPAASLASSNVMAAESELGKRIGFEQSDQARELLPFEMGASFLAQRMSRETTGYTTSMQNELSAIISKIQMGVEISENEKNRAQELAIAEMGYKNELEKQSRGFDFAREQMANDPLGIFA